MQIVPLRQLVRVLMATALAAATLAAVGAAPGEAAVPCQRTFTNSTSAPITAGFILPIPPFLPIPGSGSSPVTVPAGTIADVDVYVHITHPSDESLSLYVLPPVGAPVVLKSLPGTAGANFAGTTFDDEAAQDIASGAPPYSGRFRPTAPLSVYDGTAAGGTWSLNVTNSSILASGTIDSWSMVVTYTGTCDYDSDAVEDHSDACVGLAGPTASGCPLASSSLTAKYRHGKFKGVLSSTVPACRAGKSVTIWKVRRGPDRQIGTRTTASDGTYKLRHARRVGRYYATSPRVVLSNVAECPAVTSPRFRIR